MTRPSLGDLILAMLDALDDASSAGGMRLRTVSLTLPVEMTIRFGADGALEVAADAPAWRWRTMFDRVPSRMTLLASEGDPA